MCFKQDAILKLLFYFPYVVFMLFIVYATEIEEGKKYLIFFSRRLYNIGTTKKPHWNDEREEFVSQLCGWSFLSYEVPTDVISETRRNSLLG